MNGIVKDSGYNSLILMTNLSPAEHVTNRDCFTKNAFTMFIQVLQNKLLYVHLKEQHYLNQIVILTKKWELLLIKHKQPQALAHVRSTKFICTCKHILW